MDFDDYIVDEYEEVLPQDKEFKSWIEGIERDYANEMANIDVNELLHAEDTNDTEDDTD